MGPLGQLSATPARNLLGVPASLPAHDRPPPWYSEVPVSDNDRTEPTEPDDIDFDREVAAARQAAGREPVFTQEEAGLRNRIGWGRSPIIAFAVIVVGFFLLVATWSDFRYFLRVFQSAPRELGSVEDIYQAGEFTEDFDDEWVVLEGDPDVQHAARTASGDRWYGLLRLLRADAKLFVAIPRAEQEAPKEFPGRHEGRMMRLSDAPQWEKLQEFFDAEAIVDLADLDPGSVLTALEQGSLGVDSTAGDSLELRGEDTLRVVVQFPVGLVQLGRSTWKTRAAAEQAVASLGLAWAPTAKSSSVTWQFVIALDDRSPERLAALTKQLEAGLDDATKADIDKSRADPKKGALVMPRKVTYLAKAGELALSGDVLSLPYDQDSPEDTGWTVVGDKLEPIAPVAGKLAVPRAQVVAVRLERELKADPDGYLIMVGQGPREAWPSAVMFVGVFGVMVLNALALVRRRRPE